MKSNYSFMSITALFLALIFLAPSNLIQAESSCGNEVLEPDEECEDANQTSGDGCSAECLIEIFDCKGILNGSAKFDTCGVCDGDDSTCRVCESSDNVPALFQLDGGITSQYELSKKSIRVLKKFKQGKISKVYTSSILETAKDLHNTGWENAWSLPLESTSCSPSTNCTYVSFSAQMTSFISATTELDFLIKSITDKITAKRGKYKALKVQILKSAAELLKINLDLAQKIQASSSMICS